MVKMTMARKKLTNEIKTAKIINLDAKRARQTAKKQAEKLVKEHIKEMRPYLKRLRNIDLRSHLTKSQKAYVKKAYEEYERLTARPVKIYRTKNKKRLKQVQNFSTHRQTDKNAPIFDVAFVPAASDKAKIKFRNDQVYIQYKHGRQFTYEFNLKNLTTNPQEEIQKALDAFPKAKQFVIMAGEALYNGGISRTFLYRDITNLMARYSPGGDRYGKEAKSDQISGKDNHYEKWLFGVKVFEGTNQDAINDYRKAFDKKRRETLDKRGKARRRKKKLYGKAR